MKTIIFDFDGTIGDSLKIAHEVWNFLAPELGYKPLNDTQIQILRDKGAKEFVKEFNLSPIKIPRLLKRVHEEMGKRTGEILLFPDMKETLLKLKEKGNSLGILTSNSVENVETFIKLNQLGDCFDFIQSEANLFGKSETLRKIIKERNLNISESFYVGDETRDIEACNEIGMRNIAVTWGYNSKEALEKLCPTYIVEEARGIAELF